MAGKHKVSFQKNPFQLSKEFIRVTGTCENCQREKNQTLTPECKSDHLITPGLDPSTKRLGSSTQTIKAEGKSLQ